MTRTLRRITIALAAPVAWIGCFSNSSGGNGPGPQFDGSFDGTEFDTSIPESSVDTSVAESAAEAAADAIVDSSIDATMDATAEANVDAGVPVVITVVGAGGPEPGVIIVYDDPTGAYVAMQTTDANGRASRVVASGSMVTALLGSPTTYSSPFTIMGVQPGDALTVVDWGSLPSSDEGTRVECTSVSVTEQAAPLANTSSYLATSGLNANQTASTPLSVPLGGQCATAAQIAGPPGSIELGASLAAGQPTFPMLLEAVTSTDTPLGYLFKNGNPLPTPADGGDAATAQVTLAGAWSTTYTTQTVNITNVPDGGQTFTPILSEVVSGTLTTNPFQGTGVSTFWTHPGFADFIQAEAYTSVYYLSGLAMATALPVPTADATINLDLTPLGSMPVLSATSVDTTDPARPAFTWTTSSGSLASVTGIVLFASFGGAGGDGGATAGNWTIVAPASSQASVQAPELPSSLSAWTAPSAGFAHGNLEVWGLQGSALPSYGAVRAAASAFKEQPACAIYAPLVPALPAVGTSLMITMWSNAICS